MFTYYFYRKPARHRYDSAPQEASNRHQLVPVEPGCGRLFCWCRLRSASPRSHSRKPVVLRRGKYELRL